MKRYRLKKDLPTFKAGDEFELEDNGDLHLIAPWTKSGHWKSVVCAYRNQTLQNFPNILKDWFEEIPEKPKTVWDLKEGDEFWYLDADGTLTQAEWFTEDTQYNDLRENGNTFLTRKEAEKEREWRRAREILKRDTNGFKPDWQDEKQPKWEVSYCHITGNFRPSDQYVCNFGTTNFASEEDANASIKAHKKEWFTYLGVED